MDLPEGTRLRQLSSNGTFGLDQVTYMVDVRHAFEQVLVVQDGDKIIVTDTDGQVLAQHQQPPSGTRYVGNGRPRGPRRTRTSPKS